MSLVVARRTPAGVWGAPVEVGRGDVNLSGLALVPGVDGELVGAWVETRAYRPDGVATTTCLVAARLASGAVDRRDLDCRAEVGEGRVHVVPTGAGGSLAAWQIEPYLDDAHPFRASIAVYARSAGSSEWSPARLTVGDSLGFNEVAALTPSGSGRTTLVALLGEALARRHDGRVRVVLLRDDATAIRRVGGPPTPGRPPGYVQRYFALGSRGGLLTWPLSGFPYRFRASLLAT